MCSHNPNPQNQAPLEFELKWLKTEEDKDQTACFYLQKHEDDASFFANMCAKCAVTLGVTSASQA